MNTVILLGHRKYSGKDTVKDILNDWNKSVDKFGYTSHHFFAKELKKQVYEKYFKSFVDLDGREDRYLNEEFKNKIHPILKKTFRDILIEEGQNSRSIWKDVWANYVYREIVEVFSQSKDLGDGLFIITDFRFRNEFSYLNNQLPKELFAIEKWKIDRPVENGGSMDSDSADVGLANEPTPYWDQIVINDGSIDSLREKIKKAIN